MTPLPSHCVPYTHRFSFTAPTPGVFYESWACFTHLKPQSREHPLTPPPPRLPPCPSVHRFSFTAPTPGVFHESWVCFTHPPLEPPADKSRRRGDPLALELKGVAVADGDNGGPVVVAAAALRQKMDIKTRDAQVCCVCLWVWVFFWGGEDVQGWTGFASVVGREGDAG